MKLDCPPLARPSAYIAKPRQASGSVLSNKQKMILAKLCTAAFPAAEKCGAVEAALTEHCGVAASEVQTMGVTARREMWRHLQIRLVTDGRTDSLKTARQSEYRPLLAHFERLAGESGRAFESTLRDLKNAACHRAPGCEWLRDLNHWATRAGLREAYLKAILRNRFKVGSVEELSEARLKQYHDTVVNRARARLQLGETANRSKKQRAAKAETEGEPF